MKIFTVYCGYDHEPGYVGGVFRTYSEAREFIINEDPSVQEMSTFYFQSSRFAYFDIKEWDI